MAQMPAVIEALTGINLIDMLKALPAVRSAKAVDSGASSATETNSQPPNPLG